jgi:hypothetical protein
MLEKAPARRDAPKRRRYSCCTLILVVISAVCLFVIGKSLISLLLSLKARRFYEFPPRELFVNETDITLVANRSDVVQPLIGVNDTFDIAVTVWQLATADEQFHRSQRGSKMEERNLSDVEKKFAIGHNATPEAEAEASKRHSAYVAWYDSVSVFEKTIFSDIVFRGVQLSDTDLHTNVSFQIPTEVL